MNSDNQKLNSIYSSLRVRNNLIMSFLTGLVCVALALIEKPTPILSIILAIIFGMSAGLMQGNALKRSLPAFYQAKNAVGVRAALTASLPGKSSIWLQWCLLPLLLIIWLAMGGLANFLSVISGYAAFMCVREISSLSGLLALEQYAKAQQAE